jgi:hypothetical protein
MEVIMLSKILIATDASEASDRVLECVKELRRVGSQEALLVHAMNVQDVGGLYASLRRQILRIDAGLSESFPAHLDHKNVAVELNHHQF